MKRFLIIIALFTITQTSYSQQARKRLTEAEKEVLRQNNKGMYFSQSKKDNSNFQQLNFTNSKEQKEEDIKVTNVQYYYGKEDTLYKSYTYIKAN